jgi:hypothetical protein
MKIFKMLNPFIWLWNLFKYIAHLNMYYQSKEYIPYDFKKWDTKYF